jgi:hypothetical protein
MTNGSVFVPGVDQRSTWIRRARDLIELHTNDLGGSDRLSEAERSIVRRAAVISTELERMEAKFATDDPSPTALDLYQRLANSLRRLLESVGLERRPRDVTPDLNAYVASRTPPAPPQGVTDAEMMTDED